MNCSTDPMRRPRATRQRDPERRSRRRPHENDECLFCGEPYDASKDPICPTCGPSFEHVVLDGAA